MSANANAMRDLRITLAQLAGRERNMGGLVHRGYYYAGPHEFVLREGVMFTTPTEPHGYPQGAPRQCFGNAINVAIVHGLRYVEGYASSVVADLAVHHAWNVTGDGTVIDTTWGAWEEGALVAPIGSAYCGVEFSVERADDATWNGDATVIDDWKRSWPLLREKWHGEPADAVWPPSVRLEALRAAAAGEWNIARQLFDRFEAEE